MFGEEEMFNRSTKRIDLFYNAYNSIYRWREGVTWDEQKFGNMIIEKLIFEERAEADKLTTPGSTPQDDGYDTSIVDY